MSIPDALSLARKNSPSTAVARAKLRAASAKLQGASALANPTLSLAHGAGKDTGGLDEDILITQPIELPNKRTSRVKAARSEKDASAADLQQASVELDFEVRSAYYEALRADIDLQLAKDALVTAKTFATSADLQFQAGDVARSNVLRSKIEVAKAEQALSAAETERENRYAALRSIVGLSVDAQLLLTDTLSFTPSETALTVLRQLGLKNRPELVSVRNLVSARAAGVRVARDQSLPDLFLEARHSDIDPAIGGNSIRAGILIPLFDYGRIRADTRAAKAALDEQKATLEEATRAVSLEVETAYRNLAQASKAVESFRSGRLDRAKELLEMAQIGYQKGASSYLELLDAQQVYRSEQAEYAKALAAHNIALATLQKAVGGTLP